MNNSNYSSTGSFYAIGDDADKVGPLFTDWLKTLNSTIDLEVTSYNYNFYFNHKGEVNPLNFKKAEHPNKNGEDSYSVRAGV